MLGSPASESRGGAPVTDTPSENSSKQASAECFLSPSVVIHGLLSLPAPSLLPDTASAPLTETKDLATLTHFLVISARGGGGGGGL